MNSHRYSFFLLLSLLFLMACATGSKVEDLEYPIGYLHDAIKENLPAPIASISQNGRNYITKAYAVPLYYKKRLQPTEGPPVERAYAKVSIHGITRPYTIAVRVEVEELVSGPGERPRYTICCRNKEMEKDLTKAIRDYLVKRYKNPNLIDDFRVF